MRNIEFINAGAGSGKTFALTHRMLDMVVKGDYSPDQFIMTTFTKAAAADFYEKTKSLFYEEGRFSDAARLELSAFGTIHSIAYDMVRRYWYLLGLAPELAVIESETASRQLMDRAFEDVEMGNAPAFFEELVKKYNITVFDGRKNVTDHDYWKSDLQKLLDAVNTYSFSRESLNRQKEESLRFLDRVFGTPVKFELGDDEKKSFLTLAEPIVDEIQRWTKKSTAEAKIAFGSIDGSVESYVNLYKAIKEKASNKYMQKLQDTDAVLNHRIGTEYPYRQELYDDLREYIDLQFTILNEWIDAYNACKEKEHLLDFNDLERKFLELLDIPEAVNEISERCKVLMVDEFQDCSPIQIRIFSRLSEIMEKCIWVGDVKQAIYGFRGTDVSLVKNMLEDMRGDNTPDNSFEITNLKKGWRSTRTLTAVFNKVFRKAFPDLDAEGNVCLEAGRKEDGHIPVIIDLGSSKDVFLKNMVKAVEKIHSENGIQYKDIAVLFRQNKEVWEMAGVLQQQSFKYEPISDASGRGFSMKDMAPDVFNLLVALLSVLADDRNRLSKAIIVNCCRNGFTASRIISDRLRDSGSWLEGESIFRNISQLRNTLLAQPLVSAVESLFEEIDAADLIRATGAVNDPDSFITSFITSAEAYESECRMSGQSSSLTGFLTYLDECPPAMAGDPEGVKIGTYHSSKGLEWKAVILGSLDENVIKSKSKDGKIKTEFIQREFGVNVFTDKEKNTHLLLIPDFWKTSICDSQMDEFARSVEFDIMSSSLIEEDKRLMYVGMTRARDMLVFAAKSDKSGNFALNWLRNLLTPADVLVSVTRGEPGATVYAMPAETGRKDKSQYVLVEGDADSEVVFDIVSLDGENDEEKKDVNLAHSAVFSGLKTGLAAVPHAPRYLQPSAFPPVADSAVKTPEKFAERLKVRCKAAGEDSDAELGNCIHQIMCTCLGSVRADSHDLAREICVSYSVEASGQGDAAEMILSSASSFMDFMRQKYGEAESLEKELPFTLHRDGQEINGEIDLVYRTEDGDVLVDYKTFSGASAAITEKTNAHCAEIYSGQLKVYKDAMEAAGRRVRAVEICYIVQGLAVGVEFS